MAEMDLKKAFSIAILALVLALTAYSLVQNKANKTTFDVEMWLEGTDGNQNFSLNDALVSNSSEVVVNGLSKDLFIDYNESTSQSINFSITLNNLDKIKVKYATK